LGLLNNIFTFLSRFSKLHISLKEEARPGAMAQYGKLSLAWSFYEEAKARLIEAITEEHSD